MPDRERPAYDDAPPFWTDADTRAAPTDSDAPSGGGPRRAGGSGSRTTLHSSREGGEAHPLALIEDVFPGKVMEFTPAPGLPGDGETDLAGGNGAEPASDSDEPNEPEDLDD